jgi:GTPase
MHKRGHKNQLYVLEKTVSQLEKILKSPGCKKVPLRIKDEDDAVTAATNFDSDTITYYLLTCIGQKETTTLKIIYLFVNT